MKYRLKEDRLGLPAGTIVYNYVGYDYGLRGDDYRATGIEHVCVTQDPNGGTPFITATWPMLEELADVEEIGDVLVASSDQPFIFPESWEATPYGEHWSFAYTTERGEREDYDFRIEFDKGVGEIEEQAVIRLLESAPRLLEALQVLIDATSGYARHFHEHKVACAVIAEAKGLAA